jgi:hypothetical protein
MFRAGQLLTGIVSVVYNNGWWLPREAVMFSGDRAVVFRKRENVFEPVEINIGSVLKDEVLVTTNITDWKVAANASFMEDSDGFTGTKKKNVMYEE